MYIWELFVFIYCHVLTWRKISCKQVNRLLKVMLYAFTDYFLIFKSWQECRAATNPVEDT